MKQTPRIVTARHPVWFIVMAYIFTWALTVPMALGVIDNKWHTLGAFGPAVAALIMWRRQLSWRAIRATLLRLPERRGLYLAFLPLLIGFTAYNVCLFFGTTPSFRTGTLVTTLIPVITYALFEEIGWRGYLLPALQARYRPMIATLVLTGVWIGWHIPFFGYRFSFSAALAIGFIVSIVLGSYLLSMTYNLGGASIVAPVVFHLSNNLVSLAENSLFLSVYSTILIIAGITLVLHSRGTLYYRLARRS